MRHSRVKKITGTIIKQFFIGKYLLWCQCFAPYSAKDPQSEYMKMLSEIGYEHEDAVIAERFPGLEELELKDDEVLDELRKGSEAFSNIRLTYNKYTGKPDLLVKKKGKSELGEHYYVVKEIKSAKNLKLKHIMQGAFYNYLIGKIQGYTPEHFYLINKENIETKYDYADYKIELTHAIKEIKNILRGGVIAPSVGTAYPWENYAIRQAKETKDITLIQGITESNRKWFPKTIRSIANSHSLTDIHGIGTIKGTKIKRSAQAILANAAIVIKKPKFDSGLNIYFDLETAPVDEKLGISKPVNYLFGLLIKNKFIPILAKDLKSEKVAFKEFLKELSKYKNYTIYVYSGYESKELARMFQEFKIKDKTKVLGRIRDLHKDVKAGVQLPTLTNGLKDVAKYYGFKWRSQIKGQDSIALYIQGKIKEVIDYNEDDVRATKVVKDALSNLK